MSFSTRRDQSVSGLQHLATHLTGCTVDRLLWRPPPDSGVVPLLLRGRATARHQQQKQQRLTLGASHSNATEQPEQHQQKQQRQRQQQQHHQQQQQQQQQQQYQHQLVVAFLRRCLQWQPSLRATASELLQDPLFSAEAEARVGAGAATVGIW